MSFPCVITVLSQIIQLISDRQVIFVIQLNYRDPQPIYEQIKKELRRLILSRALSPGEKLPSVRELASQLTINPNTIQRAYRELEAEGYIVSIAGKGSFVADVQMLGVQEKKQQIALFTQAAAKLRQLGLTTGELISLLEKEESN